MKPALSTLAAMALAVGLAGAATDAQAKGCVRGAIAGGVAGHVAGHHGLMGAAAGCVIARHHYRKQAEAERARQMQARRH